MRIEPRPDVNVAPQLPRAPRIELVPAPPPEQQRASASVTGWAAHVPGRDAESVPADQAHLLLGRKGLLSKEPATRLALCAAHRALGLEPRAPRPEVPADPETAVVVSSNLGNVETVVGVARAVSESSVRDVSPLDAPNASSNVIASTLAIWFRFGGPNLMVCSGATGGLDAFRLACLMLAGGRARRVLVVGVEPDDPVASALHAERRGATAARPLRSGAAAVLLEPPAGASRTQPRLGPVRAETDAGLLVEDAGALYAPRTVASRAIDLEAELGSLYGALGVLQVAAAAELLSDADRPATATVVCGDPHDGWRSLQLTGGRR